MECPACGRTVAPDDRFCNGCGTSLANASSAATAPADDGSDAAPTDAMTAPEPPTSGADAGSSPAATEESEPGEATAAMPVTEPVSAVHRADDIGERTELIEIAESDGWEPDAEPTWARTGTVPSTPAGSSAAAPAGSTDDLPATEPITEVWMTNIDTDIAGGLTDDAEPVTTPYDFAEREPVATTGQIDVQPTATQQMPTTVTNPAPVATPGSRFRFGLLTLIALVAGVVTLGAMFADIIVITSDVRLTFGDDTPETFRTGTWIADDLADNLSVAGLIAVVLMVAGGVAGGFGWRWGSGLAGGAGLATAGLAALTVGLAQFPVDVARQFAAIPSDTEFVLTITRDLGYWLLVAGGALGIVLFFASINDAVGDRRAGLNPWIAALGALAVVVAVAGPLINENQALFSDNWYLVDAPGEPSALLLVARLVQLGLILVGGVVGFLSVRRWGLGVAVGATMPAVWLALSVLLEITDRPVGPGFRNPGAVDMHLHGVTIIGMSAVLAMIALAVFGAYDQGVRERR